MKPKRYIQGLKFLDLGTCGGIKVLLRYHNPSPFKSGNYGGKNTTELDMLINRFIKVWVRNKETEYILHKCTKIQLTDIPAPDHFIDKKGYDFIV